MMARRNLAISSTDISLHFGGSTRSGCFASPSDLNILFILLIAMTAFAAALNFLVAWYFLNSAKLLIKSLPANEAPS
jgi:hypothetical protein